MLRAPSSQVRGRLLGEGPVSTRCGRSSTAWTTRRWPRPCATWAGTTCSSWSHTYASASRERPTVVFAYTIKGWGLPIEGHPNNHSALLTGDEMGELAVALGVEPGRPVAAFRRALAGGPAVRRRGRAPAPSDVRGRGRTDAARSPRTSARRRHLDAGRARTVPARPAPGGAGGGVPGRDAQPGRRLVDEPGRLDQPDRRVVGRRPARLVRRRRCPAAALGRGRARPAHRAGHRGDEPGRARRRARRDVEPVRPAATADRDPVRPVRGAGAGAVVVRDLRGRPVDPGRHAVRGDAGAGGRRPPVDHDAVDRPGAARMRRLGAGVRPGPGVVPAAGAVAGGRPGGSSAYFRLSTRKLDQALADHPTDPLLLERRRHGAVSGGYRITRRAAVGRRHAGRCRRDHARGAGGALAAGRPRRDGRRGVPDQPGPGVPGVPGTRWSGGGRPRRPGAAGRRCSRPSTVHRSSRCSTGTRTRCRSSPGSRGDAIRCLGVTDFGQASDLADAHALHGIDADSIAGAALDLLHL